MAFLPTISKATLEANKADDWDFIYTILDPYQEAIDEADDDEDILDQLTDDQHVLLVYDALYGQVTNGGFLQLIHNGYGQFIFGTPFIENLQHWGLTDIMQLLQQAETIYTEHQDFLEQDRDLEAFSALYKDFTHFEPMDDAFYAMMDKEVSRFRAYIEMHLNDFAHLVD